MTPPELIVIIGFMACGKTEVARLVAQELNVQMVDLDEVITSNEGRSPAALIREEGERRFRKIETANLQTLLQRSDDKVIALGGGAWIEAANRKLLAEKDAKVVWLDTPFDLCWQRIESSDEDRPLGSSREQASQLYEHRRPIYELASIRVEVTADDDPRTSAAKLVAKVRRFR